MHILDSEPGNSFASTVSKTLKIDQMNNEAVQRELYCRLKEGILALTIAMENPNRAPKLIRGQ